MTTTPTKPSTRIRELAEAGETHPFLLGNGAKIDAIIAYLDEQHAAGRGETKPVDGPDIRVCHHHRWTAACYECKREAEREAAPATPETGERAPLYCSGGCGKPSPRNPTAAVKYTCYACAHKPDAPIAEPPAPVAGEPKQAYEDLRSRLVTIVDEACGLQPVDTSDEDLLTLLEKDHHDWRMRAENAAGESLRLSKLLASANARAEALESQLATAEAQRDRALSAVAHEQRERAWAMTEYDRCLKAESALAEANARYERSQAQTDDYERALEAERRHTALLTQALVEARSQLASEQAAHEVTTRAAWLNGQAVGVEDTLRVIMLDRGAKFASHFRPIDSDLTRYPEDIPASPSEPAPVASTDLCRCSWPAPPLGPHHSVECPMFRAADPVAEPERAATLTEIQRLADIYRDNCAYGRPSSAEAVLLAVCELNKPFDDLAAKALTEPPIRAGASPEAEPQHLGAGITDPLPPAVECCECGHPKQWHSKAGWCRMALDIGEECPCRCYAMKMTLLIGSRASSPAPTELDGADGVVGSGR